MICLVLESIVDNSYVRVEIAVKNELGADTDMSNEQGLRIWGKSVGGLNMQ